MYSKFFLYLKLNKFFRIILYCFISGLCGTLASNLVILPYHLPPIFIIIALIIFLIAKNRIELILFITFYHAMSASSLMLGYQSFFRGSFFIGIGLVSVASLIFSSIIGGLSFNKYKLVQILLINFFWCIPFFIIGWAAPFFAAGYFLPNLGWIGLFFFIFLVYFLTLLKIKYQSVALCIIFGLTFIPTKNHNIKIQNINTHFKNNLLKNHYEKIFSTFQVLKKENTSNITILPEDALPCFDENIESLSIKLITQLKTPFILSGATTCFNKPLKSGIVLINKKKSKFIYTQRQPIPYVMYIPFSTSHFESNWFNNGIIKINGIKYGLFVCFEAVLGWTYLQTLFYKPDILLSFNSVYWDKTGNVKMIQDRLMYSMARLFQLPYQGVWNY